MAVAIQNDFTEFKMRSLQNTLSHQKRRTGRVRATHCPISGMSVGPTKYLEPGGFADRDLGSVKEFDLEAMFRR